nr:calcium-binding protein [uncultured Campylobacter sp.]
MQTHTVGSRDTYLAELRGFIVGSEGFDSRVYLDGYGKLTIGYGYNISDNDFVSDFAEAGISLTQEQIDLLNDLKDSDNKDVIAYNLDPNSITINEAEANTLYNTIIENKFEAPTLAKFNETRVNELMNTKELIALVSLAYNGGPGIIGPNLTAAINDGDRVAAWYEIRYASNIDRNNGIQNRRVKESNKFGLYDNEDDVGDNEAKHVIRFLEIRRRHIDNYLSRCLDGAITHDYDENDLNTQLTPAINQLVERFGDGQINAADIIGNRGKILVGQGVGNNADEVYADRNGNFNDTITGTNRNDLIFGERGNDTINAADGDDVIYGGEGSDTLNGGNGYDIYHADENDTINDSDGSGKVYLSETKLKGGRFIKEQSHGNIEIYKSNDDSITYEYNTSTKVLSANGLKINDFDNNELEINLQKEQSNEFAILSDTTGSMGGAISSVKSQAKEIIKTAFARDKNTKVGVFGYNDPGVQTFTNLTNDQNAIMSAINSLYADGGGDTPEMTWHGIYNAANSNWSEYSVKRIFVFGDAPAKDNEFKSKAMAALLPNKPRAVARSLSAANALYGNNHSDLNNIQVFTIQTGGGEDVAAEFKELAESTGGGYVNMTNSGYTSVADALFDAMNTGTSKNETIVGNEKNNIINGKGGDDVLEGREGSDTYVFEENFGKDTIIETNKENKDKNIIDMSAFSLKDVVFRQNKNDVVVNRSKFDAVTIRDFYSDEEKISQIKFKDVTLGYEEIKEITALQSNKEVVKFANKGENKLKALLKKVFFKADDETATTIKGGVRSDALVGSNLNDKIYGNLGHDTLIGGKGDDYLDGGLGNDKYIFCKGDGKDIIKDCGGKDTLILKDINQNELKLSKDKNDLILKFKEGSDQITIKDHFKRSLGYNHRLENIKFADGTQMSYKQIEDIVRAGEYTGGFKQASFLKNDYFVPQDTVNKIIEQLNSYADNSQALEFMSNNAQKDNIQIYMS